MFNSSVLRTSILTNFTLLSVEGGENNYGKKVRFDGYFGSLPSTAL
jgi:hypothetical protein